MKNNRLKKISIEGGSAPLNRFNPSGDCHITMGFGEISPTYCMEIEPNSSMSVNRETLALLAPMVAPTMGRMNLETFGVFVPTKSVLPFFDAYLAKKHFNYAGISFTPTRRLMMPRYLLNMFCLIGARATLWLDSADDSYGHAYVPLTSTEVSNFITGYRTDCNSGGFLARGGNSFSGYNVGNALRLTSKALDYRVGVATQGFQDMAVPLYNPGNSNTSQALVWDESDPACNNVHPDAADATIFFNSPSSVQYGIQHYAMCFKLSAFGARIKKIMDCMGVPFDFNDATEIDITPFLAYFIAYYEFWAPKLWENYEDTPCAKLINTFMYQQTPAWSTVRSNSYIQSYQDFFYSLGQLWFTDEKDFVSAHQANVTSNSSSYNVDSFIDVDSSGVAMPGSAYAAINSVYAMSATDYQKDGHAAIKRLIHSQVDANLVKRLYRWSNINSVLGQRTADILKAMGFGDWLDAHKVHFVGHSSVPLRISNVISQSDTYKEATSTEPASGSALGEYGGRGLGYDENASFSYRTNEKGYFILMSVVVPKSGYAQSLNPALIKTDADSEYQPMFDALGMEITPKSSIAGESSLAYLFSSSYTGAQSFGYIPRSTKYKIGRNINAGQFALRSMRKSFAPYTLDKLIYPCEEVFSRAETATSTGIAGRTIYRYYKSALNYGTLPTAGTAWDYVTRWTWLNNLSRIFLYRGEVDAHVPSMADEAVRNAPDAGELCYAGYDNFIVHFVDQAKYYAHMFALEDSFETLDDGNDGKPNSEFVKA